MPEKRTKYTPAPVPAKPGKMQRWMTWATIFCIVVGLYSWLDTIKVRVGSRFSVSSLLTFDFNPGQMVHL
jgi:hypothetical protein